MNEKRPDNLPSVGTGENHLDPVSVDQMSNADLLKEIETLMETEEEMDTDKIEEYLSLLQQRAPIPDGYDPEEQWKDIEKVCPMGHSNQEEAYLERNWTDAKRRSQ